MAQSIMNRVSKVKDTDKKAKLSFKEMKKFLKCIKKN